MIKLVIIDLDSVLRLCEILRPSSYRDTRTRPVGMFLSKRIKYKNKINAFGLLLVHSSIEFLTKICKNKESLVVKVQPGSIFLKSRANPVILLELSILKEIYRITM